MANRGARMTARGAVRRSDSRSSTELKGPDGAPIHRGAARGDSWLNMRTGIGTSADKTMHGYFAPVWRIDDAQLTNLYNGSALAAKVVSKRPFEMFRRGYDLQCDDFEESELEELRNYALDKFGVDDEFRKGAIFGGLFGGFLTILLADDGNLPSEPLDESRIKTFRGINGVDRRFAYVLEYYNDPLDMGNFGRPKHYLISNAVAGFSYTPSGVGSPVENGIGRKSPEELRRRGFGTTILHESRVIRWTGIETDQVTMQTLAGWSWSRLQRVYDSMRDFEHAFRSVGYLLSDASQGVLKMDKLFDAISRGKLDEIHQRARFLDEMRSVMHMLLIDTKEEFKREQTPMGGIADVLDRMMLKFAGDVDMPATELFGRAPQGMNATGESDTRKWYDTIQSEQSTEVAPRLKRFYRVLSLAADSPVKRKKSKKDAFWTVDFHPLYTPTDKEAAETDLAIAQRDQIMMDEGVVSPEEVFLTHQEWYPSADVEARENAIKGLKPFDPHENEEPEPNLVPVGGETPSPNVGLPVPGTPGGTTQEAPQGEKSGLAKLPGQELAPGPGTPTGGPAKKLPAKAQIKPAKPGTKPKS